MVIILALAGMPETVDGIPVPVIIPSATLAFLAAVIAIRLYRDRGCTKTGAKTCLKWR